MSDEKYDVGDRVLTSYGEYSSSRREGTIIAHADNNVKIRWAWSIGTQWIAVDKVIALVSKTKRRW